MVDGNGWGEHKRDVLHSLERLERKVDAIACDLGSYRERLRAVEVRAIGLSAVIALLVSFIMQGLQ